MIGTAPRDGIPVEVVHEVPGIWWDVRHRKERLAALVGRTSAVLRVVPRESFREYVPPVPSQSMFEARLQVLKAVHLFEGRTWNRFSFGGLDAVREYLSGSEAPSKRLRLNFVEALTTRPGLERAAGRAPRDLRERYDAEASAFFAAALVRDFAYDGRCVWSAADWPGCRRQPALSIARQVLHMLTDLRRRDPEADRMAGPVRRIVARDAVGAVPDDGLHDALVALRRLCERLAEIQSDPERRETAARWASGIDHELGMLRERARTLDHADAEALSGLAPGL